MKAIWTDAGTKDECHMDASAFRRAVEASGVPKADPLELFGHSGIEAPNCCSR